jgi:molybdopterin-synthase adenylyltransferase
MNPSLSPSPASSPDPIPDRDLRQRAIVPPDRLAACRATVVGVGAIGRQVALQLAALGVCWLQLIDFDTVEPVNLACQGYLEADLGKPKVQATAALIRQIHSRVEPHLCAERFRRSMDLGDVLFVCVDKIETRKLIWDATRDRVSFLADGRMNAEVVRVLAVCDPAGRRHYPTTLFPSAEAYEGACTSKSTIFTSNIAAGLMLEQFTRWLRGLPVDADMTLNLLAGELQVAAVA